MEHDNIVAIEDENIILCETYDYASIEVDMPDVETSTQEVDVSQPWTYKRKMGNNDACLMLLRTLMDIHIS